MLSYGLDALEEERFDYLALRLFEYQFERNEPYRNFCLGRGVTPKEVSHWWQAPAVPTAAFKEARMACFPPEQAVAIFESSGTTGAKRSKHYLSALELYETSLLATFKGYVFPDGAAMPMLVLAPTARQAPQSSLSHMLSVVARDVGGLESRFYVDEAGLDVQGLAASLRHAEERHEPVCLLGTAFAFVHFVDHCQKAGLRFALPTGSRLMDTGGYKGRSREVPKQELYDLYEDVLGIPGEYVVNEYGMTEMGSQFYDNVLRDAHHGAGRLRYKVGPPWVRTVIVDPETMEPTRRGGAGLLRHCDLANVDSVMAIQTDDLGMAVENGFEITGRALGAEARGCSITADELLSGPAGE